MVTCKTLSEVPGLNPRLPRLGPHEAPRPSLAARGECSPGWPAGSLPPASATRAAAGQPRLGQECQIAVHLRPAETRSRDSPSGAWKGTTCPGRCLATLSLNELRVRKDVLACHPRKCPPPHANLSSGQRVGEAAGGGDAGKRRPPAGAKTKPGPEAHANTRTRRPCCPLPRPSPRQPVHQRLPIEF